MKKKVLMVDDEPRYCKEISEYFSENNFDVMCAGTGEAALRLFSEHKFDIVLLDVGLPDMSGYQVFSRIRKESDVLIIFVTARVDVSDALYGFELGADDYIMKPYLKALLLSKVQALLCRTAKDSTVQETIDIDGIIVNHDCHTVSVDGNDVILPPKAFDLLYTLMKNNGRVLTRDLLLNLVWEFDFYGDSRVVDTQIKNIRKALGDKSKHIVTVSKVGYRFE